MVEHVLNSDTVLTGVRAGAVLSDRYRVDDLLATGAMGVVFRGHDALLDRPVAVKMLHPHLATTVNADRFVREGQTVAALGHPNLVSVYDMGSFDGLPYLVMEYVQGEDLLTLIERNGPPSPEDGIRLALQICRGMAYAHARGVVHRDIKPQNILVGPCGHVEIVDFGIARGPEAVEMTEPGSVIGTADYLAPEVVAGSPASVSSDLYALGVVLYRMFTGRLPFEGDNPVTVAMLHRTATPFRPSSLRPGLPPALEAVILRLLEKDPARRFVSAAATASALAAVMPHLTGGAHEAADPETGAPAVVNEATAILPAQRVAEHHGADPWWLVMLISAMVLLAAAIWH